MTDVLTEPVTDAEIIAESISCPDRFGALYERHARVLYGYACRRLGKEVAEDVVADAFVAAFRARGGYDVHRQDARPWLFAIVNREMARHHGRERARYRALSRVKHEYGEESLADRVAGSVTAWAWRAPLAAALAKLPRRDRDVLLMIAWGGLSYDEVAQALEIPIGTVRSRLNRARRKVREALPEDGVKEPA